MCNFVLSGPPLLVYPPSYFRQKSNQGQTSLPLITWGRGDGCNRRGNDAAGVEGSELLHLNCSHGGNRREVGRLRHQGLLLHQLEDREREMLWWIEERESGKLTFRVSSESVFQCAEDIRVYSQTCKVQKHQQTFKAWRRCAEARQQTFSERFVQIRNDSRCSDFPHQRAPIMRFSHYNWCV